MIGRSAATVRALFSFRGRIGRMPFALAMVAVVLLAYGLPLRQPVDRAIHALDPTYPLEKIPLARDASALPDGIAVVILILAAALTIALVWGSLSALARRFHDMSLSAWLILPALGLALLVPNVGPAYLPPLGFVLLIAIPGLVPGVQGSSRFDATPAVTSPAAQRET